MSANKYTSIGGQAVVEGVMMRSPHAFVVAVRKPDGKIRLRRDQWFGLSSKIDFLKKPFLRGVIVLIETMANGIVSLNYSSEIAEGKEQKTKGVNWATFLSMAFSLALGLFLFVFIPHALTYYFEKNLQTVKFNAIDGGIKALFFLVYVYSIGFLPDVKRVFQYHGAEHKSISTFEAGLPLTVENARTFPTFHPRCGTTFVFFLMFVSIFLFTFLFALFPITEAYGVLIKHSIAVVLKISLSLPIAGISYELIKKVGACPTTWWGKAMTYPGMLLQKLTTAEPDDQQLEVALASIRTVLLLEEKHELKTAKEKKLQVEELDIDGLASIEGSNLTLNDFLEL